MFRKSVHVLMVTAIVMLTLAAQAGAQSMRIYGALSNFDCYNDSDSETEGFEIEIEDCPKSEVVHTYGGSAFGAPTIEEKNTAAKPAVIVRYRSTTRSLAAGAMTHFGVTLRKPHPATALHYRWLPKPTAAIPNPPPVPLALPKHEASVTTSNGVPLVHDVIRNTEPDGGKSFWVLPYAHFVPRPVELEELMRDDPVVTGGVPMGSGPFGTDPEKLDPGDTWQSDDPAGSEEDSAVFTFEIYEDVVTIENGVQVHTPGRMVSNMMNASLTTSGPVVPNQLTLTDGPFYGSQTLSGTVQLNGVAPAGGLLVHLTSSEPDVTLPATVTVPAGAFSADFTLTTHPVAFQITATISASSSNSPAPVEGYVTVIPPDLTTLWLAFKANFSGSVFDGAVYLISPAPPGGMTVALSSSNPAIASVPATVTVPEGETTATFPVETWGVTAPKTITIQANLGTVTLSQNLTVNPSPLISGVITLQNCFNPAQDLLLEFRPVNGGTSFFRSATLSSTGAFQVNDIPPGPYQLAIKGSKWLRKVISVNSTTAPVTNANTALSAADANDDNSVDVLDLDALIQAFDAVPGDGNWNSQADFNCDDSVDVFDLDLLIQNFDKTGDA